MEDRIAELRVVQKVFREGIGILSNIMSFNPYSTKYCVFVADLSRSYSGMLFFKILSYLTNTCNALHRLQ